MKTTFTISRDNGICEYDAKISCYWVRTIEYPSIDHPGCDVLDLDYCEDAAGNDFSLTPAEEKQAEKEAWSYINSGKMKYEMFD